MTHCLRTGEFLQRLFTDPQIIQLGELEAVGVWSHRVVTCRALPADCGHTDGASTDTEGHQAGQPAAKTSRVYCTHACVQYESIGGSPIHKWTELQGANSARCARASHAVLLLPGAAMVKHLDELSPATAPHKHYVAFR